MDFFKGYVETKNKKCIEKFKGRNDLKTYEQVRSLPEFAGVLNCDTILIDVDDHGESDKLLNIVRDKQLNCRVYETTRGKHFLFHNTIVDSNRTHATLAIGISADIKLGKRNSYSVLKFQGKERRVLYDLAPAGPLPKWLLPIKGNTSFVDMEAGDGRNQALFNYILTLQAADFTIEEIRETIRLINRYILKEPLPDNELEVILRDEAFEKPVFYNGPTFLFDKFATYLKDNNHIIRIYNQLHIYKDGVYVSNPAEIEATMIKHLPRLNRAKRNEVMLYLDLLIRENTQPSPAHLIAFKNGIYNLLDDSFVDFAPEHVITNKINWDYKPGAYFELTDKTLDKIACHDKQLRLLLEEAVGYCFYRRNELGKAFILTGEKNNGKSTYLSMVQTLLGEENVASLDLNELGDRFRTAELFGKLANIGDDISDDYIADAAIFKKLVTGDRITVERKGQHPFELNNQSKLMFSANNIPRMGKGRDSGAILRRLVIIPFKAIFDASDPDFRPYIKYELQCPESFEYMIQLGIAGLKRVLINQKFTETEQVKAELVEYEIANNPVIGFFNEIEPEQIENEPTKNVYRLYTEYCINNSLKPVSNIEFSKQVKKRYGYVTKNKKVNGQVCKVYILE